MPQNEVCHQPARAPVIEFPDTLPVSARRADIEAALREHPVVVVSGETGSGKTTQLPKIALAMGRGGGVDWQPAAGRRRPLIGHTQPRRLAATSVAARIAEETRTTLGELVGYQIRFHDRLQPGAAIKLMTDGILLAETQRDPLLRAYDTLIIDEAHERSLNIDFLLGYVKQLLPSARISRSSSPRPPSTPSVSRSTSRPRAGPPDHPRQRPHLSGRDPMAPVRRQPRLWAERGDRGCRGRTLARRCARGRHPGLFAR
jgi:energy-coupling factor transporter ATP-binding protein EcfA2